MLLIDWGLVIGYFAFAIFILLGIGCVIGGWLLLGDLFRFLDDVHAIATRKGGA